MSKFHEVFIPFTDVYRLGGSNVFKQLGAQKDGAKNLIVLPMETVDRLEEGSDLTREEYRLQGNGAKDTLRFLKNIRKNATNVDNDTAGVTLYHLQSNLAVAALDAGTDGKEFSIRDLESRVTKKFPSGQGDRRPTLITSKARNHFKFGNRDMRVEDPGFLLESPDIIYEGILEGNDSLLTRLHQNQGAIDIGDAEDLLEKILHMHQFVQFSKDDFAVVTGDYERNKSESRILGVKNQTLRLLSQQEKGKQLNIGPKNFTDNILGVYPLDMEQYLAFQYALMDPDVELAFVCGGAGSGKTILSYAAAVDQVLRFDRGIANKRGQKQKSGRYEKIVLLKPFEIMGGDRRGVGFLPGDLFKKIKNQLESYEDAHRLTDLTRKGTYVPFEEMFLHPKYENDFGKLRSETVNNAKIGGSAYLPSNEVIELTYSGFLRGRSFHNTLVLVDEAQNFTPYEVKTIISRLGPGCKAIIMGDPYDQIDNPHCSQEINGLTHSIREFLPKEYSALVPLSTLHRSQMAEDAHNWKGVFQ